MKKLSIKSKKKPKPFSKLSQPEKRVAIARDVLLQIKHQKYIANAGAYIKNMTFDGIYINNGEDIKKNFKNIHRCSVCAMGACLLSATKFANKLSFDDIGESIDSLRNDKVRELFASIFSPLQLLMIETAFEGKFSGTRVGVSLFDMNKYEHQNELNKCIEFYHNHFNAESRMITIMKNIIKNKGEFKP